MEDDVTSETFSRKQLAWMGLLLGTVIIVLLNVKFGYRSTLMDLSGELFSYKYDQLGYMGLNIGLLVTVWLGRRYLGILFALAFGTIINLVIAVAKLVIAAARKV
jgi:hypothetical protein